jgi:P27 family predicted phage terminase small subunit
MGHRGPISRMVKPTCTTTNNNTEPNEPSGLDAASIAEWQRVTNLLRDRNALDGLDQVGLHDYLQCWQRLRQCEAQIERDGVTVKGERGFVKHPAAQIARQYRDSLFAWSKELGLTYGSRQRLLIAKSKPEEKENHWTKFLRDYPLNR